MQQICGGTVMCKTTGHINFNFDRLRIFLSKNPKYTDKKLIKYIFQKDKLKFLTGKHDDNSYASLIKECIFQWRLNLPLIHSMGFLHNQICKLYLHLMDGRVEYNEEKRPGNYTPESTKLSCATWDTYPENKLQGFCPCEPLVRLKQLADFPIQDFVGGEIMFDNIQTLPKVPQMPVKKFDPSTSLDQRFELIRGHLREWELYYNKMLKIIETLIGNIMELY